MEDGSVIWYYNIRSQNKKERKGVNKMKKLLMAAVVMVVIIAVQIVLSYVFSYRVAEIFSGFSVGALFYYSLFTLTDRRKKAKAEK